MAADPKNIFNFGTGDIDKDQWLKDIDNGQEEFITTYGSATNKHRTALLRLAFLDLRSRLASGDMLRRNSDGMYEFSSALNRDDKHMQEAYERALGFMGNLARKQINTPKPEPEKKKVTGSTLEDEFKKSLGPDGRYNETAYWARTPEARGLGLQQFLTGFKNRLNDYQDFSSFTDRAGLEAKIDAAIQALNNKKYNDWSISELGFTKDWINKPKDEDEEPEESKSELKQALEEYQAAIESQLAAQIRQQLASINTPAVKPSPLLKFTPKDLWLYEQFINERNKIILGLKYIDKDGKEFLRPGMIFKSDPVGNGKFKNSKSTGYTSWTGEWAKGALDYAARQYNKKLVSDLTNYFSNLGVSYLSYLDKDKGTLMTNLAKLFTLNNEGNYMFNDTINLLFTKLEDGSYGLKGTALSYNPSGVLYKGTNTYKEGGILKGEDGLPLDGMYDVSSNKQNKKLQEQKQQLKTSRDPFESWTTGDYALLGSAAADVASMAASYIPGGQLASGLIGAGSTLTSSAVDFARGNYMSGGTNLVLGLGADIAGMLPVVGTAAKTAKIAKTLGKLSKVLVPAFTVMGATLASGAMAKLIKGESLTPEDWQGLSQGIQLIISGGAKGVAGHKNAAFKRTLAEGVTHYDVKLKDGTNTRITKEEFEGAKRNDYKGTAELNILGKIKGKPVVTKEGINSAHKNIVSESLNPLNSASTSLYNYMLNKAGDNGYLIKAWTTPEWSPLKHLLERRLSAIQKIESQKTSGTNKPHKKSTRTPKKKNSTEKKELGGILKALRNGGILKGQEGLHTGVKLSDKARGWHDDIFSNYEGAILDTLLNLEGQDREAAVKWLNDMLDLHSALYRDRGDFTKNTQYDLRVEAYQKAYKDANGFIKLPMGFNIGIQPNYNTRYDFSGIPRISGDNPTEFNDDGLYSQITDDRRVLGRLNDWSPERLSAFNEKLKTLGYTMDNNYNDKYYRIKPLNNPQTSTNPNDDILKQMQGKSPVATNTEGGVKTVVDTSGERLTITQTDFKNPFDPSHLITAGKLFQAIRGNANIYGNLLKEMPQAPLRDPIHRQLAIVGNLRVIDEARNKIGDLRQINRQLFGSDQQTNFATSLETERTGRDIYDKSLDLDATRQFDTALKLWNLKNEDTFYNTKVGDDNRKSIADRARMMAQIRAAWRSGDQNAIMGALADEGNWFMKKYQREQDIVNLAREQQLGSREQFLENYIRDKHKDYDALKAKLADPKVSDAEKALIRNTIQQWNLEILREAPAAWSLKIYNAFHTPGFGGGYKTSLIGKDGVKLEVEKLKARGKDNDRYVSMIKDLRKTSYRRRRR